MSDITLRFWGTRGSIPVPGRRTQRYGGNTTCLEVIAGGTLVVIDAGSGMRDLGERLMEQFPGGCEVNLLFTHTHWDHIQGFPFFVPAFISGNQIDIYGDLPRLQRTLETQMESDYFPVPFSSMGARIRFRATSSAFQIGPMQISTIPLPHPGGCLGYRFETKTSTLVVATDCELELLKDKSEHLRFFANADLIVIDCQYTDAEYKQKVGWGHNSISTVVELGRQVKPKTLVLTHHDPASDDGKVDQMAAETSSRLRALGVDINVFAARERTGVQVSQTASPALAS